MNTTRPDKGESKEIPVGIKWEWDETKHILTYKTNVTLSDKTDKKKKTRDGKIDLRSGAPRIVRQSRNRDDHKSSDTARKPINATVSIADIKNAALYMLSERYYIPIEFESYCNNRESKAVLDEFLLNLANYFYWFFESIDSKIIHNPMIIERNDAEKKRIEVAEVMIKKNLKSLARIYCMLILGLGSSEYHHMMAGRKRVSCGFRDRGIFETLYPFCTFFIWITFKRRDYEIINKEIGRMLRSEAFNNSLKFENNSAIDEESGSGFAGDSADMKLKGNSKEAILNRYENNRQHIKEFISNIQRKSSLSVLNQRSPALVSLLPLPHENSKWLFDRRGENLNKFGPNADEEVDDDDLELIQEVGIIGQPLKLFQVKTLALKGTDDEQNAENKPEDGGKQAKEEAENDDAMKMTTNRSTEISATQQPE